MRLTKGNLRSMLVTLSLALMLALASCKTCPAGSDEPVVPAFPTFPSPVVDGKVVVKLNYEEDIVSMPYWYWISVTNYVVDTEAAIDRLKIDLEVKE